MKNQKGITLVEIIAVLIIVSIVGVMVVQYSNSEIQKSRQTTVEADFRMIKKALDQYTIEYRSLPNAATISDDSEEKQEWLDKINYFSDFEWEWGGGEGSYLILKTKSHKDPWDEPYYMYLSNAHNRSLIILSGGPNKQLSDFKSGNFEDDLAFIYEKK